MLKNHNNNDKRKQFFLLDIPNGELESIFHHIFFFSSVLSRFCLIKESKDRRKKKQTLELNSKHLSNICFYLLLILFVSRLRNFFLSLSLRFGRRVKKPKNFSADDSYLFSVARIHTEKLI